MPSRVFHACFLVCIGTCRHPHSSDYELSNSHHWTWSCLLGQAVGHCRTMHSAAWECRSLGKGGWYCCLYLQLCLGVSGSIQAWLYIEQQKSIDLKFSWTHHKNWHKNSGHVWQRQLAIAHWMNDITLFDYAYGSVHKHVKRELDQYSPIRTSRSVNKIYILENSPRTEDSQILILFNEWVNYSLHSDSDMGGIFHVVLAAHMRWACTFPSLPPKGTY